MTQFRQCFITNSNPCLVAQASVHSCGGADKVIKTELPALVGTADVRRWLSSHPAAAAETVASCGSFAQTAE